MASPVTSRGRLISTLGGLIVSNVGPCESYKRLRRRYFALWFQFAGVLLIGFLVGLTLPQPFVGVAFSICAIVSPVLFVSATVTWFRLLRWPCPRCSKSFVCGGLSTWPTDHCKHCGLSIDTA